MMFVTRYLVCGGFSESIAEQSNLDAVQKNVGEMVLWNQENLISIYKWHDNEEAETVTVVFCRNFSGEVIRIYIMEDTDCTCCDNEYENTIEFL